MLKLLFLNGTPAGDRPLYISLLDKLTRRIIFMASGAPDCTDQRSIFIPLYNVASQIAVYKVQITYEHDTIEFHSVVGRGLNRRISLPNSELDLNLSYYVGDVRYKTVTLRDIQLNNGGLFLDGSPIVKEIKIFLNVPNQYGFEVLNMKESVLTFQGDALPAISITLFAMIEGQRVPIAFGKTQIDAYCRLQFDPQFTEEQIALLSLLQQFKANERIKNSSELDFEQQFGSFVQMAFKTKNINPEDTLYGLFLAFCQRSGITPSYSFICGDISLEFLTHDETMQVAMKGSQRQPVATISVLHYENYLFIDGKPVCGRLHQVYQRRILVELRKNGEAYVSKELEISKHDFVQMGKFDLRQGRLELLVEPLQQQVQEGASQQQAGSFAQMVVNTCARNQAFRAAPSAVGVKMLDNLEKASRPRVRSARTKYIQIIQIRNEQSTNSSKLEEEDQDPLGPVVESHKFKSRGSEIQVRSAIHEPAFRNGLPQVLSHIQADDSLALSQSTADTVNKALQIDMLHILPQIAGDAARTSRVDGSGLCVSTSHIALDGNSILADDIQTSFLNMNTSAAPQVQEKGNTDMSKQNCECVPSDNDWDPENDFDRIENCNKAPEVSKTPAQEPPQIDLEEAFRFRPFPPRAKKQITPPQQQQ